MQLLIKDAINALCQLANETNGYSTIKGEKQSFLYFATAGATVYYQKKKLLFVVCLLLPRLYLASLRSARHTRGTFATLYTTFSERILLIFIDFAYIFIDFAHFSIDFSLILP